MSSGYDVIVIGARCGGSPTAMLLARKGYRVLLVDKATFPSDTMSTHMIHPPGVAALEALGAARAPRGHGLPADHEVLVRLRADHARRRAAAGGRRGGGVLPAADRARRAAGRGRRRGRRRAARGIHGRRDPDRGRRGDRHPRPREGRRHGHRAGARRDRRGRQALARGARPCARSTTTRCPQLAAGYYAYWSGLPVERLRDLHPRRARARLRRHPHPRRPDLRGRRLAARAVRRPTARTSRATT